MMTINWDVDPRDWATPGSGADLPPHRWRRPAGLDRPHARRWRPPRPDRRGAPGCDPNPPRPRLPLRHGDRFARPPLRLRGRSEVTLADRANEKCLRAEASRAGRRSCWHHRHCRGFARRLAPHRSGGRTRSLLTGKRERARGPDLYCLSSVVGVWSGATCALACLQGARVCAPLLGTRRETSRARGPGGFTRAPGQELAGPARSGVAMSSHRSVNHHVRVRFVGTRRQAARRKGHARS